MEVDAMMVFPARPDSVAEWEDLLVRLEIVPRVVRNIIDDVTDPGPACHALQQAADREGSIGRWLEVAAQIDAPGSRRDDSSIVPDAAGLALRFASRRARTFAMVQRRGLEVWLWEGPLGDGGSVTVHQLLLWLAQQDAALLAALRRTARAGAA